MVAEVNIQARNINLTVQINGGKRGFGVARRKDALLSEQRFEVAQSRFLGVCVCACAEI